MSDQAEDVKNIFVSSSRQISLTHCGSSLTVVGLKAKRASFRGGTTGPRTCFFSRDPLGRIAKKRKVERSKYPQSKESAFLKLSQEKWSVDPDKESCEENLAAFKRTIAWKFFEDKHLNLANESPPEGTETLHAKTTVCFGEVLITAALHCITVAKGLPPFILPLRRIEKMKKNGYMTFVEKSRGSTLHEYLETRQRERKDLHLEAILTQVCLALRNFQKFAGFVHNDLHTHNIMIEERSDRDRFVVHTEGQCFVFPPEAPFVRIIDFGQSAIVHPLQNCTVSTVFTAPMMREILGTDIAKLTVCLVKWAKTKCPEGKDTTWEDVLGGNVSADVLRVLSHISNDAVTSDTVAKYTSVKNKMHEYFPMKAGDSVDTVLREGACARLFIVPLASAENGDQKNRTVNSMCYHAASIFFERENDVWCSRNAICRYRTVLERRHLPPPVPLSWTHRSGNDILVAQETVRVEYTHVVEYMAKRGILQNAPGYDDTRFSMEPVRQTFNFKLHGTSAFYRRRVVWTLLELFQRGVLFFLRLFITDEREKDPHSKRVFDELHEQVGKISNRDDKNWPTSLFVLCLIAVTGSCDPFLERDYVRRVFSLENAEVSSMNHQIFQKAKIIAGAAHDTFRFGSKNGQDHLAVPAQWLTHADAYAENAAGGDDFPPHHFALATDPLFYGRVVCQPLKGDASM